MEQPEFRGLSKESNSWNYGFGWYETDYTEEYLEELGQLEQDAVLYTETSPTICNKDSMGQYTGLKDIEGCKIYAYDLVEFLGVVYTVIYFDGYYALTQDSSNINCINLRSGVSVKVVGNIFENSELKRIILNQKVSCV